jgi:glycerol kinase
LASLLPLLSRSLAPAFAFAFSLTTLRSTALGAALLAGSALKLFDWDLTDPDSLDSVNEFGVKTFNPTISKEEREWK